MSENDHLQRFQNILPFLHILVWYSCFNIIIQLSYPILSWQRLFSGLTFRSSFFASCSKPCAGATSSTKKEGKGTSRSYGSTQTASKFRICEAFTLTCRLVCTQHERCRHFKSNGDGLKIKIRSRHWRYDDPVISLVM